MSKRHEPYRIYRAVLYLYPKSHREAYGEQMVQTLDDMLSDQRGKRARYSVWLRIIFELPVNVIEENINSTGGISVNKLTKVTNKQYVYILLAALVVGSYVIMAVIWRHQRAEVNSLNSQLQTLTDNQVATNGGDYNAVTIIPSESAVYMPLANLKLSATNENEKLVYAFKDGLIIPGSKQVVPAQLKLSTHNLAVSNYSTTRQFNCTEIVYADFVTPSYPVNPKYKSNGSVKLADGRMMNIYYASEIPGCEHTWQINNIDSKAIADALKQAVSY
jgi:hypothetical protein